MAKAEVVSSGIVGYSYVPVSMGYSAFTPVFKDVSGDAIDLKSIVPYSENGSDLGTSKGKIYLYKLNSSGDYANTYNWNSSKGGWCVGSTLVENGAVTLANGEGLAVYNNQGRAISFQVSGAVDLVCLNAVPMNYSMFGNFTPVQIDLQDITPKNEDGTDLGSSKGKIYIYVLDSAGAYTSTYNYNSSKGGWCVGSTLVTEGTQTFDAGAAFAVYNNQGKAIAFQLPSPIQ